MKSLYSFTLLFFSCLITASTPESFIILKNSTQLVHDVQAFLDTFQVQRSYTESKQDFLERLKKNNECEVVYAVCSSFSLTEDKKIEVDKSP